MTKPLVFDLYCGLGGWSEGFIAEGYDCIGFDITRHDYGTGGYPGQLVLQDVCTIHGAQLIDATALVASSPCQEFSYRAMPWKLAKAQGPQELNLATPEWWSKPESEMDAAELAEWKAWLTAHPSPPPVLGINLFWQAFRIQQEIFEACGRWVPLVAENVKGAQPWIGKAKANYGSFYLWGDINSIGGRIVAGGLRFGDTLRAARRGGKKNPDGTENGQGSWFKIANSVNRGSSKNNGGSWFGIGSAGQVETSKNPVNGVKVPSKNGRRADIGKGARFTTRDCGVEGLKVPGINWSGYGSPDYKPQGFNVTAAQRYRAEQEGTKQGGDWLGKGEDCSISRRTSSRSDSRKAASAAIAKIPLPLSRHIARVFAA